MCGQLNVDLISQEVSQIFWLYNRYTARVYDVKKEPSPSFLQINPRKPGHLCALLPRTTTSASNGTAFRISSAFNLGASLSPSRPTFLP